MNETIEVCDFRMQYNVSNINESSTLGLNRELKLVGSSSEKPSVVPFNMSVFTNAMSSGFPENEVPQNNDALLAVQLPQSACHPNLSEEKVDLVVVVHSCVYCFEKRQYSRETYMRSEQWNNFKIQFVFVVGLPKPNQMNTYNMHGVSVNLDDGPYDLSSETESFRVPTIERLRNEIVHHGDLLIGSFHDNIFNSTAKTMLGIRWASAFCGDKSSLYLFLKDGYTLHPNNTMEMVRRIMKRPNPLSSAGGNLIVKEPVGREDRVRAISSHEYPWDNYYNRFRDDSYILGADVLHNVSIVMSFTPNIRFHDVFLALALERLPFQLIHLYQFQRSDDGALNVASRAILEPSKAVEQFW
ncbi:unnamed protein product [Heterobilharzia americana]|nr:unnamed protein product [Heterobilharzia americana]